jgi:hypothetical protein
MEHAARVPRSRGQNAHLRARRLATIVVGAVAIAAAGFGYRAASGSVERRLRTQLAVALGLEPGAVILGRTALTLPLSFSVHDLSAGPVAATRVDFDADPFAALTGRLRVVAVHVEDLVIEDAGRAQKVEIARAAGDRWRLTGRDLRFAHAGLSGLVAHASAELSRAGAGIRLERAAFRGAAIGAFGGLAGVVHQEGGAYAVRAAREGLVIVGRVDPKEARLRGEARLEALPLDGLRVTGIGLDRAAVSGRLDLDGERGSLALEGTLAVSHVAIDHPGIAVRRVFPLSATIAGGALLTEDALALHRIKLQVGDVRVAVDGTVALDHAAGEPSRAFDLTASLEPASCGGLLQALRPLLPALDGMGLAGSLGGTVHVALPPESSAAELALDVDLSVGCRVTADPPLADPHTLKGPLVVRTVAPDGAARTRLLGPENASFRPLDALPVALVRTVVAAEDGRFFFHHGLDADMIRRALAYDLGAGGFRRGASTITQQVVKNVFLSGERTLTRKLEEAVLAWRTEQLVPKRRILELYLNLVELAPGIYGVGDGALHYFGRSVESLEADDSAKLAALLPAPRRGMDEAFRERLEALRARLPRPIASAGRVVSARRATLQ